MKIKEGVIIQGLAIEMRSVLINAEKIWREFDAELVVTSALDGLHSAGSLHYYGYALDFRTRDFSPDVRLKVADRLRQALGRNYRVLVEVTHIHVEYSAVIKGGI